MATIKTLDDIINKNDRYDLNKISMYQYAIDDSLIIYSTDVFRLYYRFIRNYVEPYKISQIQRDYYYSKPHLLSQDIYGTPELAWLILRLNDQECPSKFRLKSRIYLIDPTTLSNLYDTVITRSTDKVKENWNEFLPAVVIEDDA